MLMNLKYRVYSVSSENQEYPASNLQEMSGIWQSQRNCSYPQQLTVQFYIPIQTKNLKLMFHQYKIPKMIQLFVKCGKHQKYRKLGLIQPNDNTQSNYLQKQIKTVFFQFPCTFVKLVFHQNYRNQMNLFDQVALSSLIFEGQCLPSSQLKNLDVNILDSLQTSSDQQVNQSIQKSDRQLPNIVNQKKISNNFSSVLYPQIFERLENAKKQAVDRQQFQKASFIKNSINSFQQMEKQILKLQQLKRISLEQEDYDRCHKLKNEITKKKQMISYQLKQFQDQLLLDQNSLAFSRASQNAQNRSNFNTRRQNRVDTEQAIHRTPAINRNVSPNNFNQHESQIVPALRKKKNVGQSYLSVPKQNQSLLDALQSPGTEKKQDAEQVDESVDMKIYEMSKVLLDFPELQQLDFKHFKKYQQFFDYIRLDIWRMILSDKYQKNWQLKSMTLDQVITYEINEGKHLFAMMEFVAITICDKHTVNVKKSLQILQKIINLPDKDIWCDPNYPRFCVDVILNALIQLMTDTKQQFRKLAVQIYKNLPQFSLVYLDTAIRTIIKSSGQYSKSKRKSNPRLLQAKLVVIQYYLSTFADVIHHLNQIIKWLAECANDPSSQIKMAATQMLLEIARMDKDLFAKVKQELIKQSPDAWTVFQAQYNALMSQIQSSKVMQKLSEPANQESLDIYKKQTIKGKNRNSSRISSSQQGNQSQYLSPHRNKQSKQNEEVELAYSQESVSNDRSHEWFTSRNENQIKVMEPSDEYDQLLDGMCDYCYKKYAQPTLDQHLLNYCPVVIPCAYCRGAIYLREMTVHLLTACQKQKHQQCPRCMLPFEFDEINQHIARKICRKAKPHMERCPFCQEDIQPDDLSWVEHAQKCDKIVRPARHSSSRNLQDQN